MPPNSFDRAGVLTVRLWIEPAHEQGLRARITQTLDSITSPRTVAVTASADEICAVVRRWVEDFSSSQSPADHQTT